jgi:hypothetical protein
LLRVHIVVLSLIVKPTNEVDGARFLVLQCCVLHDSLQSANVLLRHEPLLDNALLVEGLGVSSQVLLLLAHTA